MGRLGSVASEQNNSSVVLYLNDGNRTQSDYCEHIHVMIIDLMCRQQFHHNKWNQQMFGDSNKLNQVAITINASPNCWQKTVRLDGLKNLCLHSYERLHKHLTR